MKTQARHINKTLATFLAAALGGIGTHRFYVHGKKDKGAWGYFLMFLTYVGLVLTEYPEKPFGNIYYALFPIPVYAAMIEALTIGLTPDEKWDALHNPHTTTPTRSKWLLVITLVLTLFCGYTALVTSIARASDLLYTSGSFG
jgi:drug/metabolite transporter superfamily protein YnfA